VTGLSDQQLRYFTEVDQQNHVAWIALDAADSTNRGLGVARFVRSREDPKMAEVAFTVIDAFQHRGLGTILLAILYAIAAVRGVQVLRANVLSENKNVCNWLRSLGATESFDREQCRFDLTVHHDPARLPRTASGDHFRQVVEAVQTLVRRRDATGS